jgi:hypothetical protein
MSICRLVTMGAFLCLVTLVGCGEDSSPTAPPPPSGGHSSHTITLINALPYDMGLVLDGGGAGDIVVALSGSSSALDGVSTANHAWQIWECSSGTWLPTTNSGTLYIATDWTLNFFSAGGYAAYQWVEG